MKIVLWKQLLAENTEVHLRGEPAFEFQRYFSNATYTINLLHSPYGVDFMNVLKGPCNGQ